MPVIREFRCCDCGTLFESMSADPECPKCAAEEPERVFLTPPGIKSPQTAFKDETVRQLADDFGLSDMSNRDGQAVKGQRGSQPAAFSGDGAMVGRLQQMGGAADNFSPVMGSLRAAGRPHQWNKVRG